MLIRLRHLHRDERGISLVFVGMGFMSFLAATTLAIDVGMFMTARSQAQNSADAGAHAGAVALAFNSYTNRSASGPAVQSAVNAARSNLVIGQIPSVNPGDVTFPLSPTGQDNWVRVNVFRSAARGSAVPTLIGAIFGLNTVNVTATATAEAAPADAETCVMPFTIPDKWIEVQTPAWDTLDTFDIYASKGQQQNQGAPLASPDVYSPPGSGSPTGYNPATDVGMQIVLKNNNQNKVAPGMYNPWDLPGSTGGNDYRDNIAGCNTNIVKIGDNMVPENGNMIGPTQQGTDLLIAKDPGAYWNSGCNCVMGSAFGISPRIAVIPLYDPVVYANGQQTGKSGPQLQVTNYLGFFIEGVDANGQVTGRITPIGGLVSGGGGPIPTGAFPKAIRLVQ